MTRFESWHHITWNHEKSLKCKARFEYRRTLKIKVKLDDY